MAGVGAGAGAGAQEVRRLRLPPKTKPWRIYVRIRILIDRPLIKKALGLDLEPKTWPLFLSGIGEIRTFNL